MEHDVLSKKAWDFISGAADYEMLDPVEDQAAYCMMVLVYSLYLQQRLPKDVAEEMKEFIFIIYDDSKRRIGLGK